MAALQGCVRMARDEQALTLQVVGWGKMNHGLPVRRLAEQCLARGTREVRVDLRHCTYMDSTFLGTLLFLQRALTHHHGEFTVLSPSPDCCRLFKQMGLDGVFPTAEAAESPESGWSELQCGPDEPAAFTRNVVEAHQELAGLSGPTGKMFEKVARQLGQELENQEVP